jgi:hypothetical protein
MIRSFISLYASLLTFAPILPENIPQPRRQYAITQTPSPTKRPQMILADSTESIAVAMVTTNPGFPGRVKRDSNPSFIGYFSSANQCKETLAYNLLIC